jgi:hypothetical protein
VSWSCITHARTHARTHTRTQVVFSQAADGGPSSQGRTSSALEVESKAKEEEEETAAAAGEGTSASLERHLMTMTRPPDSGTAAAPTTTQASREGDENTATLHIDDLPQEVQQHILSYLGPTDLLLR